jgi:hypothetical protein
MPGYRRAYKTAKRVYPLIIAAYHRWDQLSEEEKARYKAQAQRYSRQAWAVTVRAVASAQEQLPRREEPSRGARNARRKKRR